MKELGLKQLYEHRLRPFTTIKIDNDKDQVQRGHECYQGIKNHEKYDFFIRTRPDLVIFEDLPNLHHLDKSKYYYSKFHKR